MAPAINSPGTRVHASAFGCISFPFLLMMLIVLAWGAASQWAKGALLRDGDVSTGRVVELRYVPSNPRVGARRSTANSPVVVFTTRAGEARSVVGSVNRGPAPWAVGDAVEVVYDPDDPGRADLHSELAGWRLWFGIWCVVAALLAAIAALPVVLRVRQRHAESAASSPRS